MYCDGQLQQPERSLKRALELDGSDIESAPASKRYRLPTPSLSDHRLHKPLATSPSLVPIQPQPAGYFERLLGVKHPNCALSSNQPIDDWLQAVLPRRTTSAPPQLTGRRAPATNTLDDHQHLVFVPFRNRSQSPPWDMPPSQGQSISGGTSTASAQSSRNATSRSIYRSILRNNGVRIDHTGKKIPQELRKFIDTEILKKRPMELSAEEIAATVDTAVSIADSAEGNIYNLIGTAMFPVKRNDIGQGGNTPWSTDALPRIAQYSNALATPKPDMHIGYPTDMQSTWTYKENAIVDHRTATPYTRPTRSNCFPFLMFELKSEAAGGTLWQAENQAAGCGAHSVKSMRWLFREAYSSETPPIVDTVAFTVAATHREAVYHVHFYSDVDETFYMSCIGTFFTLDDAGIRKSNNIIENILEHGLGTRQQKIRGVLGDMEHCLERWKPSRRASILDPPIDGTLDLPTDSSGSSKNARLA